jgi:hypothetical protein
MNSMSDANEPLLRNHLLECARDIFAAYSVTIAGELPEGTEIESREGKLAAVIGFTGESMRGALAFVASERLLRVLYPIPSQEPSEEEVADWSGEFVNQLLGRLRNRLLPRGVEIHVSMPKVMAASHLRLTGTATVQACNLRFSAGPDHSQVELWFDALIAPGVDLASIAPSAPTPAKEGEHLLF